MIIKNIKEVLAKELSKELETPDFIIEWSKTMLSKKELADKLIIPGMAVKRNFQPYDIISRVEIILDWYKQERSQKSFGRNTHRMFSYNLDQTICIAIRKTLDKHLSFPVVSVHNLVKEISQVMKDCKMSPDGELYNFMRLAMFGFESKNTIDELYSKVYATPKLIKEPIGNIRSL